MTNTPGFIRLLGGSVVV